MAERGEFYFLRSFRSEGHVALSAYLDVSTPDLRQTVLQRTEEALDPYVSGRDGLSPDQAIELREDLEMVRIYLGGRNAARAPYLAIFSCAPELFWRVYQLDSPLREKVVVQPRLYLEPLEDAVRHLNASSLRLSRENGLQPESGCANL